MFAALFAVANAGYLGAPAAYAASPYAYAGPHAVASPALVSQQSNILRSHGNLGQVSTYSKSINTPYSSVTKSDVRVSNDALAYPGYAGYAAPAIAHGYAAPAIAHGYAAPAIAHGYAAPAYAHGYAAPAHAGLLGVAYSAAPAVAHISYSNGYGINYAY